jgi:hypothetical protein
MNLNQFRFNARRFNGGRVYDPPPIVYLVYKGDAAGGPINYDHAIAQTDQLSWVGPPLAPSTRTRFGVRVHSNVTGLTEHNTDAQVLIVVGPALEDLSNLPPAPVGLSVRAKAGGTALVTWSYPYVKLDVLPTGFHVYLTAGSTPSYATPAATVAYGPSGLPVAYRRAQPGTYQATLSGLADGTAYVVAVRAYAAAGEEANTAVASVSGDATAPANPANLSAVLSSG